MSAQEVTKSVVLQRLIVLSCDLVQSSSFESMLELISHAIIKLIKPDATYTLVRIQGKEYFNGLDHDANLLQGDLSVRLRTQAEKFLKDQPLVPVLGVPVASTEKIYPAFANDSENVFAELFKQDKSVGVLLAYWSENSKSDTIDHAEIFNLLGKLATAALSSMKRICELEARLDVMSKAARQIARDHSEELERRDDLEEELQLVAIVDSLTGILNRRGFSLQAEQSLKIARRSGFSATVIFVDIDGLKNINDTLGHEVGDLLIQDSAAILKGSFRDSDVVARYGGDEFVAFTIDSARPEAILARIQANTEKFNERISRPYSVSLSVGIVTCEPSAQFMLSEYIAQADKTMYKQKKNSLRPRKP